MRVTGKRLGWDEETPVTKLDINDEYDYSSDDLEGELVHVRARGSLVPKHDVWLIDGQVADPETISPAT